MNMNYIKRILICIPLILLLISCSGIVTVPEYDNQDKETVGGQENEPVPVFVRSIVTLDKEVRIKSGETAEIKCQITPSDAEVILEDMLINTEKLELVSVNESKDSGGNVIEGQYTLTVSDKEANIDYIEAIRIVYMPETEHEVSSGIITVIKEFSPQLPKVYITTPGNKDITSKTDWMAGAQIKIVDRNGDVNLDMSTSIRGRGNSTWWYPKKPYALKLDSKSEVLGMPKHKRWVLLANWMDRTLMRNDVAFELGRRVMEWAPRGRFVELYLNGQHLGNYYLCEQIKVDKNRVNVDELDEDTDFTDSEQLSGGYILEFDVYGPGDEANYYYTSVKSYPVAIKEPDEEVITSWNHPGFVYISGYTNTIEQILEIDKRSNIRWNEIKELIDVNSYIDWWIIHELTTNWEPGHPKSSYMFKKRNGKLFAGPLWDFDWGTFQAYKGVCNSKSLWYDYLFKYTEFKTAVKKRWAETKESYMSMDTYIAATAAYIQESDKVNFKMWPIDMNVNGDETCTFNKAINLMRSSYQTRLEFVESYISGL